MRDQRISSRDVEVVCFDIFDTVITRAVGEPSALFLLLGQLLRCQGRIPCSAEVYARQRAYAQNRAKTIAGGDPPLALVYDELVRALNLPDSYKSELLDEELETERRLSRLLPLAPELLAEARRANPNVVFVSDTTLPSEFLISLLKLHGLWRDGDRCFASCEHRRSKGEGTLFPFVARQLGTSPRRMLHHGDNARADVRNGGLSGWRVQHLRHGTLNRYEHALERHSYGTGGLSSLMAGASRLARLSVAPKTKRERTLCTVAAGVMAPTLTAWVLWIMRRAVQEGCTRLYFLSRDGQILLNIAQRLESVLRTGLELRYLYGSRQAWLLPTMEDPRVVQQMLTTNPAFQSLTSVFTALGLVPEQVVDLLPGDLRDPANWQRNLSRKQRREVERLIDDPQVKGLITMASNRAKVSLVEYLRQEGWQESGSFALVDVGWKARPARSLEVALQESDIPLPHRFLYFGLHENAYDNAGTALAPRLEAWFFDRAGKHGYVHHLYGLYPLIEMFLSGDHGYVLGYQHRDGRVHPVLGKEPVEVIEWGLPLLWSTTEAFVDALILEADLVDLWSDARPAVKDVLDLFWRHPTDEEVAAWGSFPHAAEQTHSHYARLAEPIRLTWLLESTRSYRLSLRPQSTWPAGTAAASAAPFRGLLAFRLWLYDEVPRLRRRRQWLSEQFTLLIELATKAGRMHQVLSRSSDLFAKAKTQQHGTRERRDA